jgi:alpha-beta hydrolase superfamily lysophospholipase
MRHKENLMETYKYSTGSFIGKGGDEIFFQKWISPKQKAIVVISHGLGEHSGRYMNIISKMNDKNVSFYAMDNRGHGKSGGSKGHVDFFMDFVHDLKIFINSIREENSGQKIILLGHSLGGLIAFKYTLKYNEDLLGLILSSPVLIFSDEIPGWKIMLGQFFSKYIPAFTMSNSLNPDDLSRDKDVVRLYRDDPLVHDRISARLFTEMATAAQECLVRAYELRMPLLIFHGSSDKIVNIIGSEKIFENASSSKKEYYPFIDLYHETMNEIEPERNKVLTIVSNWILKSYRNKIFYSKETTNKKNSKKNKKALN